MVTTAVSEPAAVGFVENLTANASTITIQGFGFDTTAGDNSVTFTNGAVGSVTAAQPR